ncbi:MAG: rcc01693 family protein [Hyphomicrobiales bacterium]|nr:rcc01693 family protein [Hyphomicrobiales bacterium]
MSAAQAQPFPWDAVIAAGLGALRLSPRDFWAATPREIAVAMRGLHGHATPTFARADLDALKARFPDL